MSTIGRILVVVNLVLALLVLGAAGALLQRTEVTKQDHAAAVAEKAAVQQELDDQRNEFVARERQMNSEKVRLQEQIDDLQVQLENETRNVGKLETANQQLRGDVTAIKAKLDSLEAQFQSTGQRNADLVDRNDELRNESIAAKEAQRKAEQGRRDMEDELADLRRRSADLNSELTAALEKLRALEAQVAVAVSSGFDPTSVVAAPPIEATLADVDVQYGFVILDVGSRDQVARGYTFDVYRGGQWLGQVRVDQVYDDYSTARIVEQSGEMRRFDRATTHL